MAIELKTIDVILATASFVILVIVFFFVFQFRKMARAAKDQEDEFVECAPAAPVKLTSAKIREAKQNEKHVSASLKLQDILPKQASTGKPDVSEIISDVTEIRSRFSYELHERPADFLQLRQAASSESPEMAEIDVIEFRSRSHYELPERSAAFKPQQHENGNYERTADPGKRLNISRSEELQNITSEKASDNETSFIRTKTIENAELKLEDPLPEISGDSLSEAAALKENPAGIRIDGSAISTKTAKPRKGSPRKKKTDGANGKDDPKSIKKTAQNMRSFEIADERLKMAKRDKSIGNPVKNEEIIVPLNILI